MSNWSETQLTAKGRALDAKVTAGSTTLKFTRMKIGSGAVTPEEIDAMTDLKSPRLVIGISSCAVSEADPTVCSVIGVATSDEVETSFLVKEQGLFAMDPDEGEILYAVMLDSEPDKMPNQNVPSPLSIMYQINVVSDNATSITAVIDPAGLVSVATMDAAINKHNEFEDAHKSLLKNYVKQVNGVTPDAAGNVKLGELVKTVNNTAPDSNGNIDISGANIGDIKWSSVDLTQVGFLVASGAEVGRDTYPDLNEQYAAMGYPWGAGDGSTTFNLPNLIGKFAEGALNAGGYHDAGLPNITGSLTPANTTDGTMDNPMIGSGAIINKHKSRSFPQPVNTTTYDTWDGFDFDASKSNAIYGNSDTVQPPSALLIPYVKAFAGASADSTDLAISEVANDVVRLSSRVYLVDSKVNEDGSWYRQYSDGWVEQGGIISASAIQSGSDYMYTFNFAVPFLHVKTCVANCNTADVYCGSMETLENTYFILRQDTGHSNIKCHYIACGMGAI